MIAYLTSFRRILLVVASILLSGTLHTAHATAWTTTGAGPLTSLSSWTDGSISPSSFTTPGDTWTINHIMTMSSSAPWTVGTASAAPATVTINAGGRISGSGGGFQMIVNVYGDLNMADTIRVNGGACRLRVNVWGNVNVSSGVFFSSGGSAMLNLTVNGNLNMTGGSIYGNGAGVLDTVDVKGNLSMSGTSFITASGASAAGTVLLSLPTASGTMLINNTSSGAWSRTNVYVVAGCLARLNGNFSTTTGTTANGMIVNGGLYCPAPHVVNGTGILTVNSGALFGTGHAGGVNPAITTTGTVTLNTAATYEFNGSVAQTTGTMLPVNLISPSQLIINNATGVTLTNSVTTDGMLVFYSGILHTATNTITTPGASGSVTGTGAASYVNGTLAKTITGLSTVNYEVGDVNYAPMNLTLSGAGTGGILAVKCFNGLHPSVATSGLLTTAMANHYWRITNTAATGPSTYTPKGTYNATDILGGSNASFLTQRYEAGAWLGTAMASTNVSAVPYSTVPTSGIALPATTADIIYGNMPCGTLPITGTPTVCAGATTALANATPGGTWNSGTPAVATVSGSGLVSGLTAGTSVISYTAGGCTVTMVVTVMAAPDAGTITGVTIACIGLTTTLNSTVPGGTWSSGTPAVGTISTAGVVTGITAGSTIISYTVTNSCGTAVATVAVTVSSTLTVAPITGGDSVCVGSTITLSCATGGGTWSSFNTALATVSSGGVVTGVAIGIDTIYYTITNSCGTAKAKKVVKVKAAGTCPTTGLSIAAEEPRGLQVFPNPSPGNFTLSLNGINEDARITVTNITGRIVSEFTLPPGSRKEINLHQPPGLYIISATTTTERHFVKVRIE